MVSQVVVKGRERKKKTLRFQLKWLEEFMWLVYSSSAGGGLCKFCILFPSSSGSIDGTFVIVPFTNLQKACGRNGKLQAHGRLNYHRDAASRAQALITVVQNPERDIQQYISKQAHDQYEKNIHILSTIVKAVLYCARQNIAFRGHRDDWTSSSANKGNFIMLLTLLAEFDEDLRKHLEFGKRNALYTSKTIQNQLISIMKEIVQEKVASDITGDNGTFFSIIADEVTDTYSSQEVLSICLRFVTWNKETGTIIAKPSIKEVFFDFCFLTKTTGISIATAIKECLISHRLDISHMRGQAYDGASAMSSNNVGVQARIRESAPIAVYTHCKSHVLNLSIAASCSILEVKNMIDTINSLYFFSIIHLRGKSFLRWFWRLKVLLQKKDISLAYVEHDGLKGIPALIH